MQPPHAPTIQQVIDTILGATPYTAGEETVDTVKTGNPNDPVRGIVTTFLASLEVLEAAVAAGANFVITHEPTFYSHHDHTDWLAQDPVYLRKRRYIDEHKLVVWRFHDFWHRHRPDGINTGVLRALGWEQYVDAAPSPFCVCTLPSLTVANVVALIKSKLGATDVRVAGKPAAICKRAALLLGAWGGRKQIEALSRPDIDVLICGEINEWDINEYTRDAVRLGLNKSLVVVGHAASEEEGMNHLAEWLRARVPGVDITHIPTGNVLRVM